MAGAAPTTLSFKQAQKAFWYASLLDNEANEQLCLDLKAGCIGSATLTIRAVHRLAADVFTALKRCSRNALHAVYWEYRRGRWELLQVPAVPLREAPFVELFTAVLHRTLSQHAHEIFRRVGTVHQYAGEFLASLVAHTLNLLHAQQPGVVHNAHQRVYLSEAYPFLSAQVDREARRHFGAARHAQIYEEYKTLLTRAPYQEVQRRAVAQVLDEAPPGRSRYWAVCIAAICHNANAVDVAETLKFPSGSPGVARARVMISRVARRVHDTFFLLLCKLKMMTRKLAEFMAFEFRMPVEMVHEGMKLMQVAAMHAVDYAVFAPPEKGRESSPRSNF